MKQAVFELIRLYRINFNELLAVSCETSLNFILCLLIRTTKCTYLIFIDVKISRQQQLTDHEIIRQILDI